MSESGSISVRMPLQRLKKASSCPSGGNGETEGLHRNLKHKWSARRHWTARSPASLRRARGDANPPDQHETRRSVSSPALSLLLSMPRSSLCKRTSKSLLSLVFVVAFSSRCTLSLCGTHKQICVLKSVWTIVFPCFMSFTSKGFSDTEGSDSWRSMQGF